MMRIDKFMDGQELSTSRAFQYSLLVHAFFVLVLVLSWGHVPVADPVQVQLWSSSEMSQTGQHASVELASPKVHRTPKAPAPVQPKVKPMHVKPKAEEPEERSPMPKLARSIGDALGLKSKDEEGDILVERKHHKRPVHPHPAEPPMPKKHAYREVAPERMEKPEPRPVTKPHAKAQPFPSKRPVEHDDKADWIENQMMDQPAPAAVPHRQRASSSEQGAEGDSVKSTHGGGQKGVDCSQWGAFCSKIQSKVKGNVEWPEDQDVPTMAIFEVTLLPNGEVEGVPRLKQSSGDRRYDAAVRRAIIASSPLPRPNDPEQRILILRFKPSE